MRNLKHLWQTWSARHDRYYVPVTFTTPHPTYHPHHHQILRSTYLPTSQTFSTTAQSTPHRPHKPHQPTYHIHLTDLFRPVLLTFPASDQYLITNPVANTSPTMQLDGQTLPKIWIYICKGWLFVAVGALVMVRHLAPSQTAIFYTLSANHPSSRRGDVLISSAAGRLDHAHQREPQYLPKDDAYVSSAPLRGFAQL
jgi:hypothetical protein